ncbi:hypothetical protein [Nonomuraea sp. KM88]|uniref:hypothetical protein n=1 Tax=Nonomuraea sp. KM88 TaxID=3457427 RepID=UPI003FCDD8DA
MRLFGKIRMAIGQICRFLLTEVRQWELQRSTGEEAVWNGPCGGSHAYAGDHGHVLHTD